MRPQIGAAPTAPIPVWSKPQYSTEMDWIISRVVAASVLVESDGPDEISSLGSCYLIAGNWDGIPGEILHFMSSPSYT